MAKNRISNLAVADADVIAQVRAAIDQADATEATAPDMSAPTSRLARELPKPKMRPVHDRFNQAYGVSSEEAKRRSFDEPTRLLAREMIAKDLPELDQFRLETRHLEHHTEQLLRLHDNVGWAFSNLHRRCQRWLEIVGAASMVTKCSFSPALPGKEIHQGTEAARLASRQWEREIRPNVSLGTVDDYLAHNKPFSTTTFAAITPQEQHARVFAYWTLACERLSHRLITVIANGVDQGPFGSSGPAGLFGLIQVDELNAKATYSFVTRELLRDTDEQTDTTQIVPSSPLSRGKIRHTRTVTERQQRRLVHHSHALTKLQRFGFVDALATPSLAIPPEIEDAMRKAPPCLHNFLDIYAGSFALGITVATDLDAEETVRRETRDVHIPFDFTDFLPCDPALCLFRNFVLGGWGPAEAKVELRRRGQVRLRQMRQRQILREKEQAEVRHKKELQAISAQSSRPLYALAVTVLLLLVLSGWFFTRHENTVGLQATYHSFALCLLVSIPCLGYTAWQRLRSRARLRGELAELDSEQVRMAEELETLRETPVTEL